MKKPRPIRVGDVDLDEDDVIGRIQMSAWRAPSGINDAGRSWEVEVPIVTHERFEAIAQRHEPNTWYTKGTAAGSPRNGLGRADSEHGEILYRHTGHGGREPVVVREGGTIDRQCEECGARPDGHVDVTQIDDPGYGHPSEKVDLCEFCREEIDS